MDTLTFFILLMTWMLFSPLTLAPIARKHGGDFFVFTYAAGCFLWTILAVQVAINNGY